MPLRFSKTNSLYASFRAVGVDPSAQDFINATGITDQTQKNAINKLTLDLKVYGLWDKQKAVYPIIGGTATTHKFNLIDPRDLDAAYRLTYSAGITHTSTGMKAGANAYAYTYLPWSALSSGLSTHLSFYSRTNDTSGPDMGVYQASPAAYTRLHIRTPSDLAYVHINTLSGTGTTVSNTDSLGFYIGSRTSNTSTKLYKNGISLVTSNVTLSSVATGGIYIFGWNNLGGSTKECAFISIGDGLNDVEAFNLNSIVQNYQTLLGRQV